MTESASIPAEAAPPPRAAQLRFTDFDACAESIPDYEFERVQLERGLVRSEITRVALDHVVALEYRENVPGYVFHGTMPVAATTIGFADGPESCTRWRGIPVTARTLVAYGSGGEHVGHSRGQLTVVSLHFADGALERHAQRLGYEVGLAASEARHLEADPLAMDGLRQATQQLFNFAEAARTSLELPSLRRVHEDALLTAAVHALVPACERVEAAAHAHERAVRRAVEMLQARADEPVYVAEMCDAAQVSERTLRTAFQRVCGVSPIRYLHLHRMRQARRALLAADPRHDRVSTIATQFGFANLGRFAVEFRALFGESPSKLLRSLP